MKRKSKIIITSITAACLLFIYYNYDYTYVPEYQIIECNSSKYYKARYRSGNVYIVKNLKEIVDVGDNDIIILDERNKNDPNMKIISSNKISDKNIRNDIIEILLEYEKEYPSNWNRTPESMRLEWLVHNVFYDLNYKRNHTDNVDLDNNDENKYQNTILNKILKI